MCVLGRDVVGRPSRITHIPSTNDVIVTDDQAHRLRVFSSDDWTHQTSISPPTAATTEDIGSSGGLLHFPSGHCVTTDGRLAVIDFDSKSVVIWNIQTSDKQCSDTQSDDVVVFQTGLPCPGNVAITRGSQLAVTDSKVRLLQFFRHCITRNVIF